MAGGVVQIQHMVCVAEKGRAYSFLDCPSSGGSRGQRTFDGSKTFGLRSNIRGKPMAVSSTPSVSKSGHRHGSVHVTRSLFADNECSTSDEWWEADASSRLADSCKQLNSVDIMSTRTNELRAGLITNPQSRDLPLWTETSNWRDFRAQLCYLEHSPHIESSFGLGRSPDVKHLEWAHRISLPEVGCVLVATHKLTHHDFFRKCVIVLVEITDSVCHGIILDRSIPFSTFPVTGANHHVLLDLAGCPKYVGGPLLSTPAVHVLSRKKHLRGFKTLMPGLAVGGDAALPALVSGIKSRQISEEDINVYVSHVEWANQQLFAEILTLGWWDVVSCSSNVLLGSSTADLWQKLQSKLQAL